VINRLKTKFGAVIIMRKYFREPMRSPFRELSEYEIRLDERRQIAKLCRGYANSNRNTRSYAILESLAEHLEKEEAVKMAAGGAISGELH